MFQDRFLRSHQVAFLLGYKATAERARISPKPKTRAERAAAGEMRRFFQAIERGQLPKPSRYIGKNPVWLQSTIDAFMRGDTAPGRTPKARRGRPQLATAGDVEGEPANAA